MIFYFQSGIPTNNRIYIKSLLFIICWEKKIKTNIQVLISYQSLYRYVKIMLSKNNLLTFYNIIH